jgi:hypothetical protein
LKRILRLGRLRLHGPRGAQDEFVLAAIAQNLRRLAKLVTNPPLIAPHATPYVERPLRQVLFSNDGATGTVRSYVRPFGAVKDRWPR